MSSLGALALSILLAGPATAAERAPAFFEVELSVAALPGLAIPWGSMPLAGDVKVGGGVWLEQKVGGYVNLGLLWTTTHRGYPIGAFTQPVMERFRLAPLRAGVRYNLWPHPDWIQVNLSFAGSLVTGYHELLQDDVVIGREWLLSPGVGAGVELLLVKYKRMGVTAKGQWFLQPTMLGQDRGFLTRGLTGLGGPEVSVGWVLFLGEPS